MPLFGYRSPLDMLYGAQAAPAGKPQAPITPESLTPRRRGLFGGGMFNPDMGRNPNFGDFLVGGMNRVDMIRNRPMEIMAAKEQTAELQSQREERQTQTRSRAQQQMYIDQYIMTLPPEQQAQARVAAALDPEGFVERLQGGEWQTDGTVPYRVVNGQTVLGSGTIPHRPRAPLIQYGAGLSEDGGLYTDELPPELR